MFSKSLGTDERQSMGWISMCYNTNSLHLLRFSNCSNYFVWINSCHPCNNPLRQRHSHYSHFTVRKQRHREDKQPIHSHTADSTAGYVDIAPLIWIWGSTPFHLGKPSKAIRAVQGRDWALDRQRRPITEWTALWGGVPTPTLPVDARAQVLKLWGALEMD